MKVSDLIEKLQEMDQDAVVQLHTGYVEEYVDRGLVECVDHPHRTEIQVFIKHGGEFR